MRIPATNERELTFPHLIQQKIEAGGAGAKKKVVARDSVLVREAVADFGRSCAAVGAFGEEEELKASNNGRNARKSAHLIVVLRVFVVLDGLLDDSLVEGVVAVEEDVRIAGHRPARTGNVLETRLQRDLLRRQQPRVHFVERRPEPQPIES